MSRVLRDNTKSKLLIGHPLSCIKPLQEGLKEPMLHVFKQHAAEIRDLGEKNYYGGAGVFCALNLRYEIHLEGPPKEEEKKPP